MLTELHLHGMSLNASPWWLNEIKLQAENYAAKPELKAMDPFAELRDVEMYSQQGETGNFWERFGSRGFDWPRSVSYYPSKLAAINDHKLNSVQAAEVFRLLFQRENGLFDEELAVRLVTPGLRSWLRTKQGDVISGVSAQSASGGLGSKDVSSLQALWKQTISDFFTTDVVFDFVSLHHAVYGERTDALSAVPVQQLFKTLWSPNQEHSFVVDVLQRWLSIMSHELAFQLREYIIFNEREQTFDLRVGITATALWRQLQTDSDLTALMHEAFTIPSDRKMERQKTVTAFWQFYPRRFVLRDCLCQQKMQVWCP